MNHKNILKKLMCVFLAILIVFPELYPDSIYAVSSIQTTLLEKDPIIGIQFDDPEATEDVLNEPNINVNIKSQRNNWRKLKNYDNLPYNEIHKRVQNNIWNNPANIVDDGELKIVYNDGTYGFADISYKSELDSLTYIWEVKPSSYRDINQLNGLNQLSKYVNSSTSYRNGSLLPGNIHDSSFSFRLKLACTNGYEEWIEYVTYNVSYEVLGNGLIIYDFERSSIKYKKQKDDKSNSDSGYNIGSGTDTGDNTSSQDNENNSAENQYNYYSIPWLPWVFYDGGNGDNTGSGDNLDNNSSKPTITHILGEKQNDKKVAIRRTLITTVAVGVVVTLPFLIENCKLSTLKAYIPYLAAAACVIPFFMNNGTLVHAQDGDYYILPDTPEFRDKIGIITDAELILEEDLVMYDVPTSSKNKQDFLEGKSPVLFTFETQSNSHAVIGFGQEFGSWSFNGRNYDTRILVWDSKYSDTFNDNSCLYYSSKTFEYCIPQYGIDSSNEETGGIISVSDVQSDLNAYLYQMQQCKIMGDINLNGEVSVADVVLLCKYLTTEESLSDTQFQLSNLSGDNKVNAVDLALLKRSLLS